MKQKTKSNTTINTKYKIRMIVEIDGEVETNAEKDSVCGDLREGDAGIWCVVRWAQDDIEERLGGTCEVIQILQCNIEQSFEGGKQE